MSGHGSSRRRNYGRRQKELRDRRDRETAVDLEGPATWPRGGAWDVPTVRHAGSELDGRPGGAP